MANTFDLDQVVAHLQKIKREHGDESFHQALTQLFKSIIAQPQAERYIESLLAGLGHPPIDLEALRAEAKAAAAAQTSAIPQTPADVVLQAIRKEMPNCKTQAHFDLVMQAWEALRVYLNAAYGRDAETAAKAREGLNSALDLAPQLAELTEKLKATPEATTNRDFVDPPKQLTEHHRQKALLAELETLKSRPQLRTWYSDARRSMDSIVTQTLRDELFDAIRAKSRALEN